MVKMGSILGSHEAGDGQPQPVSESKLRLVSQQGYGLVDIRVAMPDVATPKFLVNRVAIPARHTLSDQGIAQMAIEFGQSHAPAECDVEDLTAGGLGGRRQ